MSEELTVTIDGKECTCERGEYLYDVAKRNGIFIPVLCRNDAFDERRACCRVCIVEVEINGRSKVVTSCVYPVKQECTVYTQSDKIKEERCVVLALLAHRAPEAEQIVQMANYLGGVQGFERLVSLESEKCILCGLCVQACDALATGAISTVLRGTEKRVGTPYDAGPKPCIGCLSCANICPTDNIEFSETKGTRTIWHRTFDLVCCKECGAVMGTSAMVVRAAQQAGEEPARLCDACRKRHAASKMAQTYRYV